MRKSIIKLITLAMVSSCCLLMWIGCSDDTATGDDGGCGDVTSTSPILYTSDEGVTTIMADGSNRNVIVPEVGDSVWGTVWSPDKSSVLYVRTHAYGVGDSIMLTSADGSVGPLIMGSGDISSQPWSPDGTAFVYSNGGSLYLRTLTQINPLQLMSTASDGVYINDTTVMFLLAPGGRTDSTLLYKTSTVGGGLEALDVRDGYRYHVPRIHRATGMIAYARTTHDNWDTGNEIWTLSADGGTPTLLASGGQGGYPEGACQELVFSDDGTYLLAIPNNDADTYVYRIDMATGVVVKLTNAHCQDRKHAAAYAPDNCQIVFEQESGGIAVTDQDNSTAVEIDSTGRRPNW